MESNRLTIIPADQAVYRDQSVFMNLELSNCNIPADVHALQWKDGTGWIEFADTRVNETITELPQWALDCVQVWEIAYEQSLIVPEQLDELPPEETPPE